MTAGSWNNLQTVTHGRSYTVLGRQGKCISGKIGKVTTDYVSLKLSNGTDVNIERHDVLRVTSYPSYVIYSGRSSWADVREYLSYPTEAVRVTLKAPPTEYVGKGELVSEVDITMSQPRGHVKLKKSQISTVDIISYTPLSDGNEYWAEECGITPICVLNVGLWPRLLGFGPRMRVRLFDSSLPEDNTPVPCK
jgi:hypothetical protein